MFNRLLESNRKRQRRLGGAVTSTVLHTLLIALAVRATQLTAEPAPKVPIPRPIFIDRPKENTPTPPRNARAITRENALLAPPSDLPVLKPMDFDVPGIPAPGTIPPITRGDFKGERLGTRDSIVTGSPNVGGLYEEGIVDKSIVAIPGTAVPRYPSSLQSAGLEGDVRAQFIVDTLGRVERGSVRVLDSTHELFASAVRDALARARFKPAEVGGHFVRQLAEQTFTFRITK